MGLRELLLERLLGQTPRVPSDILAQHGIVGQREEDIQLPSTANIDPRLGPLGQMRGGWSILQQKGLLKKR